MAEGGATQDPADETTPQPSQQAAAGSAPGGPSMEQGVPEDTGTSIPSVTATILRAVLGPTAGRLFLHSMERVLGTSQQWLNCYLPLGERQAVDGAVEGPDSTSAGGLWHSRLLPPGSLSGDARSRTVALVQQLWQKRSNTPHHLAQLQHILDVTEAMQQSLEEPLHNNQELWVCRNRAQANPCPHPACPGTHTEGCGTPMVLPGRVLAVGRMLAQQLQDTLVQLRAGVGRLPALLQQAARRARRDVAELYGAFSRAGSLQELLGTVVARGREVVAQAWEGLVVFLLQHPLMPSLEDAAEAPHTTPPHPQT